MRLEHLLEAEEERTRRAYLQQPDSDAASDDWSTAGKWIPIRGVPA